MHIQKHTFSMLEMLAAIVLTTMLMTMTFALMSTTRKSHIYAQQQSQAIIVLDNVIQRLSTYPTLTVDQTTACLTEEFEKANPLRKHELTTDVIEDKQGITLVINHTQRGRTVAHVRIPYAD